MTLFTVVKGIAKAAKWGTLILGTTVVLAKVSIEVEDALEKARKEQEEIIEKRGYKEPIADKVEVAVKVVKETGVDIFMGITSVVTYFGYESAAIDRWAERMRNDQIVSDLKKLGDKYEWKGKECVHNYGRPVCYTDSGIAYNRGTGETFLDAAHDIRRIAMAYERGTK